MIASTRQSSRVSRRSLLHASCGMALTLLASRATHASTPQARPADAGPLVSVDWLAANLDLASIVLVGFMPADDFASAHIPGSGQVDWPELEVIDTSDASIAAWQRTASAILGNLGITPESTVVAYDNGTLFAARLWWILHYLGHKRVHVLDGGLPAWQASGVDGATRPAPAAGPYPGTPNPAALATLDDVMASLEDDETIMVDARTEGEFLQGRIPGAVNVNYPLNARTDPPRFWKPVDELEALYGRAGVTAGKRIIPYCTSGVRSAVTFFTLSLMGYDRLALYTGSWAEWGASPETPKASGSPE